jgi:hypothetical protein
MKESNPARRIGPIAEPKMISTVETARVGGLVQATAYLLIGHREPDAAEYEACVMEAGRWVFDATRGAECARSLAAVLAPDAALALSEAIAADARNRASGLAAALTFVQPAQTWKG